MVSEERVAGAAGQGEGAVKTPSGPGNAGESRWQKFKAYFWDKLSDKLILLILSGVVIFVFQQTYQHGQKKRDDAAAAARIQTEILVKHRGLLMEAMGQYFQLLEELEDIGQAQGGKAEELRRLRKKVMVIVYTIDPIDKRIKESAEPLLQAMNKVSMELPTGIHEPKEIQKMSDNILNNYMTFLGKLAEITKKKVMEE